MRTLFEIIEAAKSGEMPTHEECYYAMLAFEALQIFDNRALMRLASDEQKLFNTPVVQYEESFRRVKAALGKSPKEWVGPGNDPQTREYQERRRVMLKILDRVEKSSGLSEV